jgi:DNA-binding GntR family transcriptional regulator
MYTGYRIPTTAYMRSDWMFGSIEDGISRRGTTQSRLVFAVAEGGELVPERALLTKIEKPPSVDDTAYVQIKQAILDCVLVPGAPLVETRLAEELGVSRTPIRRAIARLEQEGLVAADPPKGYNVTQISLPDQEEIYQLREILECYLVHETADQFSEEELDEMESALRAADQALEEEDYPGFLATNRLFHHAFDRKFGNQHISEVLANLDDHVYRAIMWGFHLREGEIVRGLGYRDHELILKAIREEDVESAVSRMQAHLRHGPRFVSDNTAG